MLKIGDFAKLSQVPVKTLRYYDEIGLLEPSEVDRFTRYRYYSEAQLPALYRILTLKELGFSLEQIALLLEGNLSSVQIKEMLELRRAEICRSMRAAQAQLDQVQTWLEGIERTGGPDLDEVIASAGRMKKETLDMEPKVVTLDRFTVVGLPYLGKNDHAEIGVMWGEFNSRSGEINHLDPAIDAAFGVCSPNPHGLVDYIAGLPVLEATDIPQGMVVKVVPAQTYVVFEAEGVSDIDLTYKRILKEWLPGSGYKPGDGPDFEYYPPEFDPDRADESPVLIYFPVKK
jgi:predicted transcriptional regulator YdeE/DNA-binding transcriptional MerR regulator